MHAADSIDLLQHSGIQFELHRQRGIDPFQFSEYVLFVCTMTLAGALCKAFSGSQHLVRFVEVLCVGWGGWKLGCVMATEVRSRGKRVNSCTRFDRTQLPDPST